MAKIHFLNVGHGDCTIIEHGNGNLSMIDINNGTELDNDSTEAVLKAYSRNPQDYMQKFIKWKVRGAQTMKILAEAGYEIELTNPIEFLNENYPGQPIFRYIQTHPDFDHMRGLAALEGSGIRVLNFWDVAHTREWNDNEGTESDKADWEAYQRYRSGENGAKVLTLLRGAKGKYYNEGDEPNSGGNGLGILSPAAELIEDFDEDGKRNELSYVLQYRVGQRRIIFGGDAEQAAWESIHQHYGNKLKCDVLKASHHGRESGYYQEAVKDMSPSVVIVSVGKKPETDASAKYTKYADEVASTRWHGNITLEIDSAGNMLWTTSEERKRRNAA